MKQRNKRKAWGHGPLLDKKNGAVFDLLVGKINLGIIVASRLVLQRLPEKSLSPSVAPGRRARMLPLELPTSSARVRIHLPVQVLQYLSSLRSFSAANTVAPGISAHISS